MTTIARQYAVVYFPDATLNVRAVGPFRSRERADDALARLSRTLDAHDVDQHPARLPQIVELWTTRAAIDHDALSS